MKIILNIINSFIRTLYFIRNNKHILICKVENNTIIQNKIQEGEIDYQCFKEVLDRARGFIAGKKFGL